MQIISWRASGLGTGGRTLMDDGWRLSSHSINTSASWLMRSWRPLLLGGSAALRRLPGRLSRRVVCDRATSYDEPPTNSRLPALMNRKSMSTSGLFRRLGLNDIFFRSRVTWPRAGVTCHVRARFFRSTATMCRWYATYLAYMRLNWRAAYFIQYSYAGPHQSSRIYTTTCRENVRMIYLPLIHRHNSLLDSL